MNDLNPRNRLLATLSPADLHLLRPFFEDVELPSRRILDAPRASITHVYFVQTGLLSVVGMASRDRRIEVGMVGCEGMTGPDAVLGGNSSPNETLVQSPATALRISTVALRRIMTESESITALLLRYVRVLLVQTSQTALANGRGKLDERLARWLLMWDDRVSDPSASITHDFVALLLGVTRPGVTVALHMLEGKGLIRSTRGRVRIVDRDGLRAAANGYYGVAEEEYELSIGRPPDRSARGNPQTPPRPAAGDLSHR